MSDSPELRDIRFPQIYEVPYRPWRPYVTGFIAGAFAAAAIGFISSFITN